ncbi:MAG TPA: glycosyltransferase family 4 protein [Vicinamibacterales bacterium]|jgi:glycosyltransferase involved in cell wall biosynthesis|nr:glycosyltransferase family 4 protein [Vicinamibacterales bacterium]HVZ22959.1 glycosyltransferase family 4 protein [Vicinamibacterales bacterium]
MRVLLVNMTLDPVTGGGTVPRTVQSARALIDCGIGCGIATTVEAGEPVVGGLDDIDVLRLPAVGGRFRVPIAGFTALRRVVEQADIVLLVNHWTPINVAAYRAARRTRTPYVVSPAGALPIVGRSRLAKRIYNAAYGGRIVRQAAGHIAITADEARQFEAYGVPADSVTVVPNGMPVLPPGDADAFRARHRLGAAPFALFLGRLAYIKGPDLLLRAFMRVAAAMPDWHLVFAGHDDSMEAGLRRAAGRDEAGRRMHFVGHLDVGARSDALAACDLVVVPSRLEAMSFVVLEAAAMARPVIATRTCGVPDVASSGGGWVVDADDESLARGLRTAAVDRAALRAMGAAWKHHAAARYGWPAIAARYQALFTGIVPRADRARH